MCEYVQFPKTTQGVQPFKTICMCKRTDDKTQEDYYCVEVNGIVVFAFTGEAADIRASSNYRHLVKDILYGEQPLFILPYDEEARRFW